MSSSRGSEQNSTARLLGPLKITHGNPATPPASGTTSSRFAGGTIKIVEDYKPAASVTVEVLPKETTRTKSEAAPAAPLSASAPTRSTLSHADLAASFHHLSSPSSMENSFVLVAQGHVTDAGLSTTHPSKHKPVATLDFKNAQVPRFKSFHETNEVMERTSSGNLQVRFFKRNPTDSLMSELEALAVGFFRLIAPSHFASARAHYDEKHHYVGVSSKAIADFKSLKEDRLTLDDLKNEELVANLATALTTSYIFEEDDLHRGNLSKTGRRIDGDGLLWSILSKFKVGGMLDWAFRTPNDKTYLITENDIRHFPNIQDATPFYWPTKPAPVIREPAYSILKRCGVPVSQNAYTEEDNTIFKQLTAHPVFIYHKFKTLLKFALTDPGMYRNIAKLHLRDSIRYNNQNLIDLIINHEEARIIKFRETLVHMPEFEQFLRTDGVRALKEIIAEFNTRNSKTSAKLLDKPEYLDRMVNIEEIKQRYSAIFKAAFNAQQEIEQSFTVIDRPTM